MKLILISGKAKSGKDASASMMKALLEVYYGKKVIIIPFLDTLKHVYRDWDYVIVSNISSIDEIEVLKKMNFDIITINLNRDLNKGEDFNNNDKFDYPLNNTGTLDDLYDLLKNIIDKSEAIKKKELIYDCI